MRQLLQEEFEEFEDLISLETRRDCPEFMEHLENIKELIGAQ